MEPGATWARNATTEDRPTLAFDLCNFGNFLG